MGKQATELSLRMYFQNNFRFYTLNMFTLGNLDS